MGTVPQDMDPASRCATRLAEAVLPDEAAIAADLTARYGAGGHARRELLRPARAGTGTAGGDTALAFVRLLESLDGAQAALRVVLADPLVANPIAVANLLVAWRMCRNDRTRRFAPPRGIDAGLAARVQSGAESLCLEQERRGTPPATSIARTELVIRVLVDSPEEARAFLDAIAPRPRRGWLGRGRG
ncbi:hypothetical protein [Catenuloplanes atrovinosus]|uniref:Uncharacterized protein n=1 Tax=Catenuloplanes atrovinosus TaxID=137266 RepID=A0AAE3YMU9_9ACTN|nr:hypothetical protein [Catenuloplanes atrovinosus]MDR7275402.1 hypothetical protein [Catenuloplanes atrovinosus]